MKTVTIHEAKTNLSKYISIAKKGEKIYIGGFGKPEVVLTKISSSDISASRKHNFTTSKGKVNEFHDSFSNSTDKSVASLLYGE